MINLKKKQYLIEFLHQAIWNWLDTYPEEFTDLQKRPNAELSGKFFDEFIIFKIKFR